MPRKEKKVYRKVKRRFKSKIIQLKYLKQLPVNPRIDDVYLDSFPRSGNTWFRFLLANAIKHHFNVEREVNFFSIQDIIPDLDVSRTIPPVGPFGLANVPRIIKTHSRYNPYFFRTILLVRDPRDVMVSYYHYLRSYDIIPENMGFSEFIRHPQFGIAEWVAHTHSWVTSRKIGQIVKVFSFEDMVASPVGQVREIMELFGFSVSPENTKKAVEASSKENMRASEEKHRSTHVVKTQKSRFVRMGEVRKGEVLSGEDKKYIEERTVDICAVLGHDS